MNFEYIEELVTNCKNGDALSKEKLAEEFRPLIFNISKRTFIHGYAIHDIQNEGYKTLFNCVSLYNLEKHRFVAYASNSIKNNINDLIKRIKIRSFTEGATLKKIFNYIKWFLASGEVFLIEIQFSQLEA